MVRKLFSLGLIAALSTSLGCAMCCSPDDPNYGAYGGRWQRQDMTYGRVGSAFAEAGYDSLGSDTSLETESLVPTPAEIPPGDDGLDQSTMIMDETDSELVSFIR